MCTADNVGGEEAQIETPLFHYSYFPTIPVCIMSVVYVYVHVCVHACRCTCEWWRMFSECAQKRLHTGSLLIVVTEWSIKITFNVVCLKSYKLHKMCGVPLMILCLLRSQMLPPTCCKLYVNPLIQTHTVKQYDDILPVGYLPGLGLAICS